MSLFDDENAADVRYGLPAGTMAALGQSESSNGANLGTIGNIFQVLPSTAANPGYGLAGVDGNDPNSVAAYVAALLQGPANGSIASALSAYQTGHTNPNYTGNAAMAAFLSGQPGGGATAGPTDATGTPTTAGVPSGGAGAASGAASGATGATPASWLSSIGAYLGAYASRGALIVLAIILLLGAIYLFAARSQGTVT